MSIIRTFIALFLLAAVSACSNASRQGESEPTVMTPPPAEGLKVATFAGGCFWCMQKPFDQVEGVTSTIVGYTGGSRPSPSYREVSAGRTDHLEAIEVTYDPELVSFDQLVTEFWHNIDPTQSDGQFADRGSQYRTAIFYQSPEQREIAEASKRRLAESGKFDDPIDTRILPAGDFWRAEEYHQHYYRKNPRDYARYYRGSGRKGFLERVWDK